MNDGKIKFIIIRLELLILKELSNEKKDKKSINYL